MNIIKKINRVKSIQEILPSLTVDDIEKVIKISADSYYNTDVSLITDEDFDVLVNRLKKLNPKSVQLKKVGSEIRGKKVKLPYWMGSMDKKTNESQVDKWLTKYQGPYLVSDKLDGVSCLMVIENDEMKLYTRGDGIYGQDITHLSDLVNISTKNLNYRKGIKLAIRAELIMSEKNFKKYQNIMANPRNMVSGIVNSKKSSVNADYARDVDLITYEIIEPFYLPSKQLELLEKWNFQVVYHDLYDNLDTEILTDILENRNKKSKYDIDGIIVTDNHKHERNVSGNPSYSFAFKGETPTAEVTVIEVLWTPSKDGILVPRIHFHPIQLSKVQVEYATGYNARFIVNNKIGPGAVVTIVRKGDVIPLIVNIIKPAKKPSLPSDYQYHWDKNEVNIILDDFGEDLTVITKRLTRFVRTIGVENLSEGVMTRIVNAGYQTIPDILKLTVDDLLTIEGFKERLAQKIYDSIQNAVKDLDVLQLMDASNIFGRGFGSRKLKKIMDQYPEIIDRYKQSKYKEWESALLTLDGFETITVDKFLDALPEFQTFVKKIRKIINVKPYINQQQEGIFTDQTVVFTGFRNAEWKTMIYEQGGTVSDSVTKNTTLLVYREGEEGSIKYKKADSLGIELMSENEFVEKYIK